MPWEAPTTCRFKSRFPVFANVPDEVVSPILDEAIDRVGETWVERDRTPAILYLTAHQLRMEGYGVISGRDGTPSGNASPGNIKRRKVGDVETEYQTAAETYGARNNETDLSGYNLTPYGRQFLLILRRNFTPIYVV